MKKTIWIYIIVLIIAVGGVVYLAKAPSGPGPLDQFATCIKDSGTKFYGAFWCPHCQATKKMFGTSASLLPYIECSTPDGNSQNATCNAAKIESYPTWEFKDGSRISGEQTLQTLAEKTSCTLPQGY
ncbi:MAG: hypothetical protein JWN50_409 [Parcubacteria group bacterium]|nr:hypothetical protein [Parcubacteria group bacterium]